MIYYTAALLAPAVPALLRERFGGGDYEYTRSDYDGEERAAALNAMADDELSAVLEADGATPLPVIFALATGRRGA